MGRKAAVKDLVELMESYGEEEAPDGIYTEHFREVAEASRQNESDNETATRNLWGDT